MRFRFLRPNTGKEMLQEVIWENCKTVYSKFLIQLVGVIRDKIFLPIYLSFLPFNNSMYSYVSCYVLFVTQTYSSERKDVHRSSSDNRRYRYTGVDCGDDQSQNGTLYWFISKDCLFTGTIRKTHSHGTSNN